MYVAVVSSFTRTISSFTRVGSTDLEIAKLDSDLLRCASHAEQAVDLRLAG